MKLEDAAALFETIGEIGDWFLKGCVIVAGVLLLYEPLAWLIAYLRH